MVPGADTKPGDFEGYDFAELLLAHGADANFTKNYVQHNNVQSLSRLAYNAGHTRLVQLLAVHGADLSPVAVMNPSLTGWNEAVSGWQPLEVAISCRLHHYAAFLLRLGRAVPAACSFARLRLAASSSSNPLARFALHGLAFPVSCAGTTTLVLDMLRGWSPGRHRLYHVASQSQTITPLHFFLDLRCVFCFQHLWCWAKQVSNPAGRSANHNPFVIAFQAFRKAITAVLLVFQRLLRVAGTLPLTHAFDPCLDPRYNSVHPAHMPCTCFVGVVSVPRCVSFTNSVAYWAGCGGVNHMTLPHGRSNMLYYKIAYAGFEKCLAAGTIGAVIR